MTWADYGMPISGSSDILGAAELVRRLYQDLREGTGGPLHWMLDDGNIYDDQMPEPQAELELFAYLWSDDFAKWRQAGADTSDERRQAIQDTCRGILYAFDRMSEAERTCVLAWHWGDIERALPDWYAAHRTPQHLASARESADEFVRLAIATPLGVQPEPESKPCVSIPCPPFIGQGGGTVWPGVGEAFAPDARITGRSIVDAVVNPDGSATVTWSADAIPAPTFDMRGIMEDPRPIRPTYPDRPETD